MVDKSVISALWVCKCAGFDSLQFPHLNLSSSLRSWQNSLSRPILQNPQMTRILTRLILVSLVGKIHHWLVRRLSMINILGWGFWCSGGQCWSASTTLLNQFWIGSLYCCCHDWLTDHLCHSVWRLSESEYTACVLFLSQFYERHRCCCLA